MATSKLVLLVALVLTTLVISSSEAASRDVHSPGCFLSPRAQQAPLVSGIHNLTINGTTRSFIVRVPPTYHPSKPHRVVVALHWFGGTMHDVELASTKYGNSSYYGLQAIAGDSTIFVAPDGLNNGWYNTNGDDMAFIDAVVATVDTGLCVDTTQRFVLGFSFGGSMSYAIANSPTGSHFRAIAVLSGTIFTPWEEEVGGAKPLAFFLAHGVRDPGNLISTGRKMRDRFLEVNGCEPQTALEPVAGSKSHIKTEYQKCKSGYPVTFIPFDGVHEYSPVDAGATASWLPREIWKFFLSAPPARE